jgi:TPR repeat protein
VQVEDTDDGYFSPLGLCFRKFGNIYEREPPFGIAEAVDDIRHAITTGALPDLEAEVLDAMVSHVGAYTSGQSGSLPQGMTESDYLAILLYTTDFPDSNSLYTVLNSQLRQRNRSCVRPFLKYVWLLLKGLTRCPASSVKMVYRGMKGKDVSGWYQNGKEFEWHQFSSCSSSIDIQSKFTGTTGPRTLFTIELTTSRGRDITAFSAYPGECEILLAPNTRFRVTASFDAGNGLKMIQLIEILPTDPIIDFVDTLPAATALLVPSTYSLAKVFNVFKRGYAKTQFILGAWYDNGTVVTKDSKEAVRWYRSAATHGDASAQCRLARCYADGTDVTMDEEQAVHWYRLAADQGYAKAQHNLGVCYANGTLVTKDERAAVDWYRLAVDQGYASAQHNLGVCYANGTGVIKDEREAVRLYQLAANQGYSYAQNNLGVCYDCGAGIAKDEGQAVRWYRLAADQGVAAAQHNLGVCFDNGTGVTKDEREAVRWYQLAADHGYASAQHNLGVCYANGCGVRKDEREAVRLYQLAADQGNADAQTKLGLRYATGTGVAQDMSRAVHCYRLSADQGVAVAQYNLGVCYANGAGVAKDNREAVRWYRLAAEQGNSSAQNNLGACYAVGTGVTQNAREAVRLYQLAAEQGDDVAQLNLGVCYANGTGVGMDESEAVRWYQLANDHGYLTAQRNLKNPAAIKAKFLQECPKCAALWNLPIDNLYTTCGGRNGCGQQFCFLCAAPYTSTTIHGAWYHRPQCTTYNEICDCVQSPDVHGAGCNTISCVRADNPAMLCRKSSFWPGPCDACVTNKTVNTCEHGNWRSCNSCKATRKECKHWCRECKVKGFLCTPPGNPVDTSTPSGFKYAVSWLSILCWVVLFLLFQCFDRFEVLSEQAKLLSEQGGIFHGHK